MAEDNLYKPIRFSGILLLVYAMAIPVPSAHAEGGRDPQPGSSSVAVAPQPEPRSPAKPKTKPKVSQTQSAVSTTPRRVQQTRAPTPRSVERAPSGLPPEGETRFVTDEVIIRFQLSSTARSRNRAIRGLGLTHLEAQTFFLSGVTVHRYQLSPGTDVRDTIAQLEASAAVVNAQPNYLYVLQQDDGISKLPQFGNEKIGLGDAHARTKGGNIRIAVIDTAVDLTHPEFATSTILSFDVTDGGSNVDPHGTSVAGILAADAMLTGVAPDAEIISIAAFSKDASGETVGNTWTILEATNVALKQKADILNMSFAGPADPLLDRAMEGAKKRSIVPVAAAGNDGPDAAPLFPAGYGAVIAVTATDTDNKVYSRANTGEHVDVAAPGVDLLVLGASSGFRTSSGTSMATAYISGIAALALSAHPEADYATLRAMLENSATDLGEPGKDDVFGAGIPNAGAVVRGLIN